KPVALKPKALDLLLTLIEHRGEILNKDELLEKVWAGQFVEEGNLTVHISALRKALGEKKKDHHFIVTVPGHGYGFVGELNNDDEVVVESHRLSRIVVEQELSENEENTKNHALVSSTPATMNKRLVLLCIVALAFVVLLAGILYTQRDRWSASPALFQQMS